MVADGIGPAVTSEELAKARRAFRGSLESSRAWRAFSPHSRHHDVTYYTLLVALFIEPGMNRMSLIERVIEYAGVSRSTAERALREAKASGFVADEPAGREVRYRLTEPLFAHCIGFFRGFMDLERNLARLGGTAGATGDSPPTGSRSG